MTFVHRFGSALNVNLPLLSAVEGAETEGVRFHEATALTDEDIAAVQEDGAKWEGAVPASHGALYRRNVVLAERCRFAKPHTFGH